MERLTTSSIPDSQADLIERYCTEARELLGKANSREEALEIRLRICSQLAKECDSPLIQDATQSYVDRFIQGMWQLASPKEDK